MVRLGGPGKVNFYVDLSVKRTILSLSERVMAAFITHLNARKRLAALLFFKKRHSWSRSEEEEAA